MIPLQRAMVGMDDAGRAAITDAHRKAVARGLDHLPFDNEFESVLSTQALLCAGGDIAVELAMLAQLFNAQALVDGDSVSAAAHEQSVALRDAAAGMARITARAIKVHARDNGYIADVWLGDAEHVTGFLLTADRDALFDPESPTVVDIARMLATELFAALAAEPVDRMGVPGHVASALGASVALFMVAESTYRDEYTHTFH